MKESRAANITAETNGLILTGTAIVFDQPTRIKVPNFEYVEIISHNVLDGADYSDCCLFYNHDLSRLPLARTPKTMTLFISGNGLDFRAILPDTVDGRGAYEAVKRGDITGMSFGFVVPKGGDNWRGNTRTINKISEILEFSLTPFPAYPNTSVEARNAFIKMTETVNAKMNINKILMRGV